MLQYENIAKLLYFIYKQFSYPHKIWWPLFAPSDDSGPQQRKRKRSRSSSSSSSGSSSSSSDSEPEAPPPGSEQPPKTPASEPLPPGMDAPASQNGGPKEGNGEAKAPLTAAAENGGEDIEEISEEPKPRALHKTASIFLRNLAPTITKAEVEAVSCCS